MIFARFARLEIGRSVYRRLLAAGLFLPICCFAGTAAAADPLALARIGRCQELVRREWSGAEFDLASWRIWDDPVPKSALSAAAQRNVKSRDLLYDGGITGSVKLTSAATASQPREAFAFCSFDNLFVWLQGIDMDGRWIRYSPTDDILPY